MRLPEGSRHRQALTDLVRSMNCYYSNLIEGHDTHPVAIERALKAEYSSNIDKRNLQMEAKAHIAVQHWIDAGGLHGRAFTKAGLCEAHQRFCALLPLRRITGCCGYTRFLTAPAVLPG